MIAILFVLSVAGSCGGTVHYGVNRVDSGGDPDSGLKLATDRASGRSCELTILSRETLEIQSETNREEKISVKRCDQTEVYFVRFVTHGDGSHQVFARAQ